MTQYGLENGKPLPARFLESDFRGARGEKLLIEEKFGFTINSNFTIYPQHDHKNII
jgi:hypothetical protein